MKFKIEVGDHIHSKYQWLYDSEILNDCWDYNHYTNNEQLNYHPYVHYTPHFHFKYEEDLVKFILKWA